MPTHPFTPVTPQPDLPRPSAGSRWRWDTSRRALVGGGTLAVSLALGLGGAAAGAATATAAPPASGQHGKPPQGTAAPTTGGRVTAVASGSMELVTRRGSTEVVTYTSTTTFRTRTGRSSADALTVGEFVAVDGTRTGTSRVAATSVTVGTGPPGRPGRGRGGPGGPGGPPASRGAPSG